MGAALLITLREGIEAALIVSILLAYLRQLGRMDSARSILWGVLGAIAVSVAVAGVLFAVAAEFSGIGEQIFEGGTTLVAVCVLTWMIFWMRRQGGKVKGEIQHKVDDALAGGGVALGTVAFAVVVREGIETALFLFGATEATQGKSGTLPGVVGGLIGLSIAATLGFLLFKGSVKLNLRTFFKYTGSIILVVSAGLLAFSLSELQEAGVLPGFGAKAFELSRSLPDASGVGSVLHALIGYQSNPTWLAVGAWFGYLIVFGFYFFRPHSPSVPQTRTSAETASNAAA
ncbi:MAG: high-affinity iron transporter [Actinomycetota bacterium]|jgi:high-affinity iron transporter|nr:high-affinity iron transporter [Actinomycetota bacterium]